MNENRRKLEKLQGLVIDALIEELSNGDTRNISVANTLLTSNKVVTQPESEESVHSKVKRAIKKTSA